MTDLATGPVFTDDYWREPFAVLGEVRDQAPVREVELPDGTVFAIPIERAHMEEDAGKLTHVGGSTGRIQGAEYSLVDYNRAGIPLVEIVTKPIIGAGALGNEILKNLALLGVGQILVADMDRVENSNLSRSVLYREKDNGELKATAAARAARDLYPDLSIHPFN